MKLFLDTSSLFKLYHKENDTVVIDNVFNNFVISSIHLSEITKIEFYSATWKKVRMLQITDDEARNIINDFENDLSKYNFIPIDNAIVEHTKHLINKYGKLGLRTLDSIQFATAISLNDQCDLFITSDKLLHSFSIQESLPVL